MGARSGEVSCGCKSAPIDVDVVATNPTGTGWPRERAGIWVGTCLLLFVLAVGSLARAAPALALSQRGHVFGFSFGGPGKAAGEFEFEGSARVTEPAGIAVDEETGDVYVVDQGNHRLQEFGSNGEFIAAWGWGVNSNSTGEPKYEVCTSDCQAGLSGPGNGEFAELGAIAVDNSSNGSHYVYLDTDAGAKSPVVRIFLATGAKWVGKLPDGEAGRVDGLAVDRKGTVWVYRGESEGSGAVEGFSDIAKPVQEHAEISSPDECPSPGFAVDAAGESFYLDHELLTREDECPPEAEAAEIEAIAEAAKEAIERIRQEAREKKLSPTEKQEKIRAVEKSAEEQEQAVSILDARPALTAKSTLVHEDELALTLEGIDRQNTSAVAVDQASGVGTPLGEGANGDVYIANGSSVSTFTSDGQLVQRFGSGHLQASGGVAVDSRNGYVYVVDSATDKVDVFTPEQVSAPTVSDLAAQHVSATEAQLTAQVDPEGTGVHYYFEYGTSDCATNPTCTSTPQPPGTEIPAGYGDRPAGVRLTGLQPSTTYYYRIVVQGSVEGDERFSTVGTITTLPSSAGELADHRAWEMVSPPEKDGSGIEPTGEQGGVIQASANGDALAYIANGPIVREPEGNRAPETTPVLSTRTAAGWSAQALVTPHEKGEGFYNETVEHPFYSTDLSLSLVQPFVGTQPLEAPPLAPGASEKTMYVRDDPPLAPETPERNVYTEAEGNRGFLAPGYLPLVTPLADTAHTQFGGQLEFLDATPDLGHVVFKSKVALQQGKTPGLYEWEGGQPLRLVSLLPGGAPAFEPELGYENVGLRNAVTASGGDSRIIFQAERETAPGEGNGAPALYLYDAAKGETIQINAAHGVAEPEAAGDEEGEVAFQGANSEGSKVFFTDTEPLTPESAQRPALGSEGNPADLYECEVVEEAGKLTCELKDLTPLSSPGSAEVLNVVPAISETGAYVYFVANGALTPGAQQGDCARRGTETATTGAACNLYVWHEGTIAMIARLANEDAGDWGSFDGGNKRENTGFIDPRPDLADVTAGSSPSGEYFAFMSKLQLTEYNNIDSNHEAEGVRDEEVYLYNAATRLLTCVSCAGDGRSVGVHDTVHAGEGKGLVVDRRRDWEGQYLAGSIPGWSPISEDMGALRQPRYLSDSGRLFFDSPDDLVPQATNGKEDVYEFEPDGVGTCTYANGCVSLISSGDAERESAFLDASESGDDAFFLTSQPLVPADHDTNYDVYDARECTEASPCLKTEESSVQPCETSRSCNGTSTSPPAVAPPASLTTQSSGNVATHETLSYAAGKPAKKPKPTAHETPLTRALKACRKKTHKKQRTLCERQARRRYDVRNTNRSKRPSTHARKR